MRPMMLRTTDANTFLAVDMPRSGSLLDKETYVGKLQRPHEIVIHAAVGEFDDDIPERIAMFRGVICVFDCSEDIQSLVAKDIRKIKPQERLG